MASLFTVAVHQQEKVSQRGEAGVKDFWDSPGLLVADRY